ncbi:hypothetical protein [Ruminococcus sp.]|nr:hypothetical protein [Ruminococcus sp.]
MTKKQDSGMSCFMIVMKFHGIPITKEQAWESWDEAVRVKVLFPN